MATNWCSHRCGRQRNPPAFRPERNRHGLRNGYPDFFADIFPPTPRLDAPHSPEKRPFINFALTLPPQDRRMVVRTRLRSIVLPIALYLVLGVASGYLVWGASNGGHGLKAAEKFDSEAIELKAQLVGLKDERARWELRVASLKSESIDKDLLDEEAHALIDRVGKDEVVIFTGAASKGR